MCHDDPNLTPQEILQRLNRKVSRFYNDHLHPQNRAPRALNCTDAFQIHLMDFLDGVMEWSEDLPQLPQNRRGEGYAQTEPSKNRLHLIKELEQFAAFLSQNLERRPNRPLNRTRLAGRQLLSVYACRELAHRASGTLAVMAPALSREHQGRPSLSEFRMFGWNSEENGVHRMKRAFTAAARDPSIGMHGLRPLHDRLGRETTRRLILVSGRLQRHVPIAPFVAGMDDAAMENLALSCLLAARDLKTAFSLWDRNRDPQLNKTVADFEKPAPLYRFISGLLEQGWPCFSVATVREEDERLMAGDSETDSFEKQFAELVSQIVECAPRLAQALYRRDDFDPLIGIDAGAIFKHEKPPRRGDRAAWQRWAPDAAGHFAVRVAKAREQIVILRDYAETTRRLNERLAERARADQRLEGAREYFNTHAAVEIYAWLRECERQYRHGVFYTQDAKRGGDYLEVKRLGVELLRHEYPRRYQAGPRFADVPAEGTGAIFESLHPAGVVRGEIRRILSRL